MIKKQSIHAYLFLGPFLLVFLTVIVFPVVFGIILSFFGQRGARMWFVGIGNYKSVITDGEFWKSFGIPVFLLFVQIPLMIFLSTGIAMLYEHIRFSKLFRLLYYLPYALPGVVAGIIWSYMLSKSMSPFIPVLKTLGFNNPELLTYKSLPCIFLIIILWEWTGYTSLVLYSTLISIPTEYSEAAQLDGATNTQINFYIKFPLLRNTIWLLFLFNSIGALQVFNEPSMISKIISLSPNYTPAMYIYNQAFLFGSFTYAIAMGIILAIIIFVISSIFLKQTIKELDSNS
jgi:multiple sugar transport system permease protein